MRKAVTFTSQLDLLMDLEEAKSSMDDLSNVLDIEDPTDLAKFSEWLNDVTRTFGEMNDASLQLYQHMRGIFQGIDGRVNMGNDPPGHTVILQQ